jgi:hypothetical protein
MSLTTNVRNRIVDALNTAFNAIGVDVLTKMPKAKVRDNKAPIAWEYFVADHIEARARARLAAAKRAAIVAGVIFDHEKFPREPGTNEPIFNGEHVVVWLEVGNGATRVNASKMSEYLIAKGIDAKVVADAYEHASSRTRPPHSFKVSLVASETPGK